MVLVQRPPVRHQVLTCLSRSCRWHWPLLASRGVSWSQASHTINQSPVDSPVTGESEPNLLETVFAVKGLAIIESFEGNSADSLAVKMNGCPTHGEIYLNPELCLRKFLFQKDAKAEPFWQDRGQFSTGESDKEKQRARA